jgi:Pro-kumamolisin, activation domain/Putative Ig domain
MCALTRLAAVACACAGMIGVAEPSSVLGRPVSAGLSRVGTAPLVPPGAHIAGAAGTATPLHLTIALRPRDPAALQAFAAAVSTPGSPEYRDYITPAQFAGRFGARPAAIQAVEASLRAHGLRPGAPSPNGLSIRVTTTAGAAVRAFAVSFAHVATRSGAGAIVNQQAPALDSSVAPHVQAVVGLDTLAPAKPLIVRAHAATTAPPLRRHVVTGGPQPCAAASTAGSTLGGFTADQIASAYGFSGLYTSGAAGGAADEGAGQNVAILELEPYDPTDIAAYQQCYGTSAQVGNVAVDGGAGTGSGSGEAALDIENVIGLAPKANIAVYEGPNSGSGPFDTFSAIISQRIAQVVTASWGQCEFINGFTEAQAENTLFQEAAAQGQSILSASGDDGAEDCFPANPTPQVDDPASQPFVTGVGGTRVSSLGPRPSETVWNDGPAVGAGGGGVSTFWNMPSYQSGAPSFLHVINAGSSGSACAASSGDCREVPDVSADSDPATGYLIYWNGNGAGGLTAPKGWQVVGGTSGAAPAWAALIALANASSACNGTAIGFANPALYNAAASGYAADFNDTTTGNNDLTGVNGGQFAAGPGYDMATGLGSPNGSALAAAMCTDAIALANPGAQRSVIHSAVSLQIHGTDTRGASVRFSATGLPAGLTINPSSGKVIGHPRRLGTSTVTVIASDAAGSTARASFAWTIQANPTLSRVSLSGVGTARPKLFFVLGAGRDAPKLKTVSVSLPGGLRFARSRVALLVTGRGERHVHYSAALKHGALVLTFRTPAQQLHVTAAYPRLQAGAALVSRLAGHHSSPLTLAVRTTDALKRSTRVSAKVRPRS